MEENELPSNWIYTHLGSILKLKNGYAFKSKDFIDTGIPVLRISNIKDEKIDLSKSTYVDENKVLDRFLIKRGDILIAMSGATTGKYGIYNSDDLALQNQRVGNFELYSEKLINKNLIYYLIGRLKKEIEDKAYGGAQPNISSKLIEEIRFPLPPRPEQDRIVAKVDVLMAQVETMQKSLERIPQLLKDFRQQVLTQAVMGKLTEDWRGSPTIKIDSPITIGEITNNSNEGWKWINLNEIAKLESGHTPRKSVQEYWENGDIPWISLQDIRAAHGKVIHETKLKPTALGIENSSARILPKGTVCFSRDISVGYTTIMGKEMATTQHFANWICGEDLNNRYLLYAFMESSNYLIHKGKGTTVKTLYYKDLNQMMFYKPPIIEQLKIVKIVDSLLEKSDAINIKYQALKTKIDTLPQAILHKAFKGGLVEQLESDGDAKELLEEIVGLRKAK